MIWRWVSMSIYSEQKFHFHKTKHPQHVFACRIGNVFFRFWYIRFYVFLFERVPSLCPPIFLNSLKSTFSLDPDLNYACSLDIFPSNAQSHEKSRHKRIRGKYYALRRLEIRRLRRECSEINQVCYYMQDVPPGRTDLDIIQWQGKTRIHSSTKSSGNHSKTNWLRNHAVRNKTRWVA